MFSTPQKGADTNLGNVAEEDVNTNQESIPVPVFAGLAKLALRWISEVANQRAVEVKEKMGKGGEQTTGTNYFGDIAGVIAMGPVDAVRAIIIDRVPVWEGDVRRAGGEDWVEIIVPDYGLFRVYWGTATQPVDNLFLDGVSTSMVPNDEVLTNHQRFRQKGGFNRTLPVEVETPATGIPHPPYRHVCYVVCKQLFFGQNRTQVPNVELLVERAPAPVGLSLPSDITINGCNPASILAEWLTNGIYGPGIAADRIDQASFAFAGARFAANPERYYLSPVLTSQGSLGKWIDELMGYVDGFARLRGGRIEIGFYPHDGVVPNVRELSHHDMTDVPTAAYADQDDLVTGVQVSYRDALRNMKEASEVAHSPGVRRMLGENRVHTYQRPWITTRSHARRWAEEACLTGSMPLASGTVQVLAHTAVNLDGSPILPGDRFQLDYLPWQLDLIVRVVKRSESDGAVTLEWEQERGLHALTYSAPDDDSVVDDTPIAAIEDALIYALPTRMTGSVRTSLGIVALRPEAGISGGRVHFSPDGTSYDAAGNRIAWGVRGSLAGGVDLWEPIPTIPSEEGGRVDLDPDDPTVPDTLTVHCDPAQVDLIYLQPHSPALQDDNTLLAIVGGEIMSIGDVSAIAPGQYLVHVLRGRYGTQTNAHASGEAVWIVPRVTLEATQIRNRAFATAGLVWFKLQTERIGRLQPLEDAFVVQYALPWRELALPVITFDPNQPMIATGATSYIYGTIEDPNEDIIGWSATVVDAAGATQVVRNGSTSPTGFINFSAPVLVLVPGPTTITIQAQDSEAGAMGYSSASITLEATGEDLRNGSLWDEQQRFDEHMRDMENHANERFTLLQTELEQRVTELTNWINNIEVNIDGVGADMLRIRLDSESRDHAQDGELLRIGAILQQGLTEARAGIEVERLARVTAIQALAQQVTTLTSQLNALAGFVEGESHALDVLRTRTDAVEGGLITEAQKATALKSELYNALRMNGGTAEAITELHTIAQYLNGVLVTHATDISRIEATQGPLKASVQTLADAFVDEEGTVKAGYQLKVDANGVITGIEASSQSAPGMPDLSVLKFQANTIQVQVGSRLYQLTEDQPVLQQLGGGTAGGDSTWRIRNAHIPIWLPTSGSWQGGAAEVKVYPDDGE
jgi:hypothetical protein